MAPLSGAGSAGVSRRLTYSGGVRGLQVTVRKITGKLAVDVFLILYNLEKLPFGLERDD